MTAARTLMIAVLGASASWPLAAGAAEPGTIGSLDERSVALPPPGEVPGSAAKARESGSCAAATATRRSRAAR